MDARRPLRKSLLIGLSAALLLLGGCPKDKALALKAAAETFRDRSVSAIDNYQNLMVTGAMGEAQPEAQQFQEVLAQLRAKSAQGRLTSADALAALGSIDAREPPGRALIQGASGVRQNGAVRRANVTVQTP